MWQNGPFKMTQNYTILCAMSTVYLREENDRMGRQWHERSIHCVVCRCWLCGMCTIFEVHIRFSYAYSGETYSVSVSWWEQTPGVCEPFYTWSWDRSRWCNPSNNGKRLQNLLPSCCFMMTTKGWLVWFVLEEIQQCGTWKGLMEFLLRHYMSISAKITLFSCMRSQRRWPRTSTQKVLQIHLPGKRHVCWSIFWNPKTLVRSNWQT